MDIKRIPVSKLNPAPYNPRKDLQPGDPEYIKLANSMEHFGYVEPIIWNQRTGNVIGGHQRLKVLVATGHTEVDVSVVDLSLADEKALNLALNKIDGAWDDDLLAALMKDLEEGGEVDALLTGFDQGEIDRMLEGLMDPGETEAYVDSFFEPGTAHVSKSQTKKEPAEATEGQEDGADGGAESGAAPDGWTVIVTGISEEAADALCAYLQDQGMIYKRLPAGGTP